MKNQFEPFGVAEGIEESLARQAKEKGIEDPFKDNYNYKIIQQIENTLNIVAAAPPTPRPTATPKTHLKQRMRTIQPPQER